MYVPQGVVAGAYLIGQSVRNPSQTSLGSQIGLYPACLHVVPAALRESGGQSGLPPLQVSATSHTPADARHVPVVAKVSAGQADPEPSQDSATSQTPAAARQTPVVANRSFGQVAAMPSQRSGRSQGPAVGRQITEPFDGPQTPSLPALFLAAVQA